LATDRRDATTRNQEVQQRLKQNLAVARRDARILVENGRSSELSGLVTRIQNDFRAAPPLTELRRLLAQCAQAAEITKLMPGAQTWGQQQAQADATQGAARLAVAAAFLLVGDDARAKTLLADPSLLETKSIRIRESLYGREAAVLNFESPADLQFIETVLGEPRFSGGFLDGAAGAPASFACSVPIGGPDWEIRMVLHVTDAPGDQAELRLACRNGEREDLMAHLNSEHFRLRVRGEGGWAEQNGMRPSTGPLQLSIRSTAGTVVIRVGNEDRFTVREARIGLGAKLLIEIGGAVWRLDDLVVVGG
jgi:hypothetical protein